MAPDADPYRTLGLTRGATLAEVKQAYRRLVKVHHPDAAGEAALPRFLAIQAAYDAIVGPGASGPGAGRGAAPRRPWDADPDRADATRRAYGGRRRTRTTGSRRPGASQAPGAPPGADTGVGSDPGAPPRGPGGTGRPPNKATLGSTSYDGADAEPFEPDWGGASWYGTTSGTYWTLNPKEYADPRKHGPEYQARARRAAAAGRGDADAVAAEPPTAPIDEAADEPAPAATPAAEERASAASDPSAAPAAPPPPTHTTSSWWDATAGPAPATEATPPPPPPPAGSETPRAPRRDGEPPSASSASAAAWLWLEGAHPSLPVRVGRGVLGWIPVALVIGWVGGELTGCARFAADCDGTANLVTWLLQVVTLGILLAAPRLATLAAMAAIAAIAVAIPAALILSAPGAEGASAGATVVLGIVLAAAWLVGLAAGVLRAVRRVPERLS